MPLPVGKIAIRQKRLEKSSVDVLIDILLIFIQYMENYRQAIQMILPGPFLFHLYMALFPRLGLHRQFTDPRFPENIFRNRNQNSIGMTPPFFIRFTPVGLSADGPFSVKLYDYTMGLAFRQRLQYRFGYDQCRSWLRCILFPPGTGVQDATTNDSPKPQ